MGRAGGPGVTEVPPGPAEEVEEDFLLFQGTKLLLVMASPFRQSSCEPSAGLQSWKALLL